MTLFHYRALNDAGKEVKGTIDASSKENALDALSQLNMKPLEVTDSIAPPVFVPKVVPTAPSPPNATPPPVQPKIVVPAKKVPPPPKEIPRVASVPVVVTAKNSPPVVAPPLPVSPPPEKVVAPVQPKKIVAPRKPKGPSLFSRFFAWLRTRKPKSASATKVIPPLVPPAAEVQAPRTVKTTSSETPVVIKDAPALPVAAAVPQPAPVPVKKAPPPPTTVQSKKPVVPAKPKGTSLFARFLAWFRRKPTTGKTAPSVPPTPIAGGSSAPHLPLTKPVVVSAAPPTATVASPAAVTQEVQQGQKVTEPAQPNFAPRNLLQKQPMGAAKIVPYSPLVSTLRLYAGWLLAWYGLVIALGYYVHVRDVPFEIPMVQGLFLSPLVFAFLLATFLFLLLSSIHHFLKGGALKGLLFAGIGIGAFWMLRKNF